MTRTYKDDTITFVQPASCTKIVRFNKATWHLSCDFVEISLSILPAEDGEFIFTQLKAPPTIEGYQISKPENFDFDGCTGLSIASTREVSGEFHSKQIQVCIPKNTTCVMLTLTAFRNFSLSDFRELVKTLDVFEEALNGE